MLWIICNFKVSYWLKKLNLFFVEMIKNDDGDEKRDEEKLDDGFTKAEFEDEEIEDEESKYITEVYVLIFVLVY